MRISDWSSDVRSSDLTTRDDVVALAQLFDATVDDIDALDAGTADALPGALLRTSRFMQHPVFNTHHSEHELLRYLRTLADKDLAMDRTMIPLGSCTMKLNATAEMIPITWPEFAELHPLSPVDQAEGYKVLIDGLAKMLAEIPGYDAVTFQPNSGAQGQFPCLLAILAYHRHPGTRHTHVAPHPQYPHRPH